MNKAETSTDEVTTDQGPARLLTDRVPGGADPAAVVVLGHGAGGGPDAVDLATLAADLPGRGIEVVRMEQPWRLAGKRIAPRPAALDQAWAQALAGLPERPAPLIVGGRSAGARVACRTAGRLGAAGCLALAFPLHPPGKADDPAKDRSPELVEAGVPTLVLQGDRDPFGGPDGVRHRVAERATVDIRVVPVPQAGHELTVPKKATTTQSEVLALIVDQAVRWIEDRVIGNVDQK